ncbi:MAG: sensor histidine kinase [Myxococcaceae bacterium]
MEEPVDRKDRLKLLSVASHELRGAVANVRSYASFLITRGTASDPERTLRCADVILRNADRSLRLLEEYFDSCKAELGGLPFELEDEDVLPLLQQAIAESEPLARERNIELGQELPDTLPRSRIDPQRMVHALRSFLEQALARTPDGGVVLVEAREEDSSIRIAIHDTGPEVGGETQRHWFDGMWRAQRERKLEPGFRVALAKQEIEALGGVVALNSGPDATTLSLQLPSIRAGAH